MVTLTLTYTDDTTAVIEFDTWDNARTHALDQYNTNALVSTYRVSADAANTPDDVKAYFSPAKTAEPTIDTLTPCYAMPTNATYVSAYDRAVSHIRNYPYGRATIAKLLVDRRTNAEAELDTPNRDPWLIWRENGAADGYAAVGLHLFGESFYRDIHTARDARTA